MPILINKKEEEEVFHLILTTKDIQVYKEHRKALLLKMLSSSFGKNLIGISIDEDALYKKIDKGFARVILFDKPISQVLWD